MSEKGAIDIEKCTSRFKRGSSCRCLPKCSVCGFGPHMAVHGPFYGKPPGSEPYDHEYKPDTPTDSRAGADGKRD